MVEVASLVHLFPAWSLTEIKSLSVRERRYWIEFGVWNAKRKG